MKLILIVTGCILLAFSLPSLWLFLEEEIASTKAYSTYSFTKSFNVDTPIEWKGNLIEVADTAKPEDEELRGRAYQPIKVKVNEEDYSVDGLISISVHAQGLSRYHGSAVAKVMRESASGEENLYFIQSLGRAGNIHDSKYRIIKVDTNKEIEVEDFDYADRHKPIYRLMLMRAAYMTSEGFKNSSHSYYPPMIMPFIMAPLGLLLVSLAGLIALAQRIRTSRDSQHLGCA